MSAFRLHRSNGDTRRKLVAWGFDVRRPDGTVRGETFYAVSRDEAEKIARGWSTRMGFALRDKA